MKKRLLHFNKIFIFSLMTLSVHGFARSIPFEDISARSGITSEFRGTFSAWGDFNNDGLTDVYICNGYSQSNILYQNLGNGRFTDVTAQAKLVDSDHSIMAGWIDIDNDGFLDLYVNNYALVNKFFRNSGNGSFEPVTLPKDMQQGKPTWVVLNQDALPDAYFVRGDATYGAAPDIRNHFFINTGNFSFIDQTRETYLSFSDAHSVVANWNDYNSDGYPDLFLISHARNLCFLYHNNGNNTFSSISLGQKFGSFIGHNVWADFDNDGDQDLVSIEWRGENSTIYTNSGDGNYTLISKPATVLPDGYEFYGKLQAIDYDNDGWLDLSLRIHGKKDQTHYRTMLLHNEKNFDFKSLNWPPIPIRNVNTETLSWADIDNDGNLDGLSIFHEPNQVRLYRNTGSGNHFIRIRLHGTDSNRDAIGAKVTVHTGNTQITRWNQLGLNSQYTLREQFLIGLGKATWIDSIEVVWPSGIHQTSAGIAVDQQIELSEPGNYWFVDQSDVSNLNTEKAKSLGATCSDFDRDGDVDIYVNNHLTHSILYQNQGDGTFDNYSCEAQILPSAMQIGSLFLDYDNDGYDDLLALNFYYKSNVFQKNHEGQFFEEITDQVGLPADDDSTISAVTADFNNDGFLDLYMGHDGPNKFYLNNREGRFIDNTQESGTTDAFIAHGVTAFDYDNDGDIDIYIANCRGGEPEYQEKQWPNILFQNDGSGHFTNVTQAAGVACTANSKGVAFADYDNDGDFDLFIANDDTANILFQNNGNGTFNDVTKQAGVALPEGAHGSEFRDFDNDGDLDLFVAGSSYVPERRHYCNHKDHNNALYRNNGDGTFTNITQNSGLEHNLAQSPHIVTADFNNDGYSDIFMCNAYYKGKGSIPNSYYQNRNHGNNWITLKLRGYQTNYNAIGATVRLKTGDEQMMRQVSVGHGYGGASDSRVYFGLGKASRIDKIEINWPSGIHQTFRYSGALNQEIEIEEPIKIAFLSIQRKTAKTLASISSILAAVLLAIFILYKILPFFMSGLKIQKEIQATTDELKLKPVSQIPILEIEIAILPNAGDYILIHQLRPSTPELFESDVFQWGWQEREPVILKKNKVLAIQQRLQTILDTHQNYIQNPEQLPLSIQKELRELGTKIHDYFGLTGFFRKLFSEPSLKNTFLQFIVDSNDIPWFLTYSEAEQKFLCDTFPISINFTHNRQSLFTTSEAEKQPFHKNIPAVVLVGNAWQNHVKQLNEADAEIRELNRYFKTKLNHSCEICKSSDEFVTQVREFHKEKKNIRIIHYSGHIEHNALAIGPDDYLSPARLEQIYALKFKTNPIIFLNGCHGTAVHYENSNLAKYFLESGASACILTHAIVPEKTARIFAHYFYDYFIQEKTTVSEALQLARQKMATNRSINSQYDITRYLYQLYGNPLIKY